jgi:hypothetical protein
MGAITMPTSPGWQSVDAAYLPAVATFTSPFTGATQEYQWGRKRRTFRFALPPMKPATAGSWMTALDALAEAGNWFVEDVSKYVATGTASKTAMTLYLVRGSVTHSIGRGEIHSISFEAETR